MMIVKTLTDSARVVALAVALSSLVACSGELVESLPDGAADGGVQQDGLAPPAQDGAPDTLSPDALVADLKAPDAPPVAKPKNLQPCAGGKCWSATALSGLCGVSSFSEDFSSGKYNVHTLSLSPQNGVKVELTLQPTASSWKPALVLQKAGITVYDGAIGTSDASLTVQPLNTGKGSGPARVRLTAHKKVTLKVFATGWSVVQSGFTLFLPKSAKYTLTVNSHCAPPKPGKLLSPPNFDAKNKVGGYYLLPQSQPPGLYTRKADGCSRGNKLLIDVLYTVAVHWKQKWPKLSPISFLDLNEGKCSTVNHQTHDDGTHADLTAGCATNVSCSNTQPGIDLAKLFVDTGQVCGIINNDPAIQKVVNAYFNSKFTYKPWHNTFMRSVSGHTKHFHVRVKKPNGNCN
jgi:hypothetical protein